MTAPRLNIVPFVSVDSMMKLVLAIGIDRFLTDLVAYIEEDFRRWEIFDKTPRVASHSVDGVIELMPTSDGRMYGFHGHFEIMRVKRTERAAAYAADADSPQNHGRAKLAARAVRRWLRYLRGRAFTPKPPYMLWELRAVKRPA